MDRAKVGGELSGYWVGWRDVKKMGVYEKVKKGGRGRGRGSGARRES